MTPNVRLAFGAGIVIAVTTIMAYVGAGASWRYYLTVDECLAGSTRLEPHRVRVSGALVPGSLHIAGDRSQASFCLQGASGSLHVVCTGPLPDNLAGSREVVVEGQLQAGGLLRGERLLTRCASKDQPRRPEGSP